MLYCESSQRNTARRKASVVTHPAAHILAIEYELLLSALFRIVLYKQIKMQSTSASALRLDFGTTSPDAPLTDSKEEMLLKYEFDLAQDRPLPAEHRRVWDYVELKPGSAPEFYFRGCYKKRKREPLSAHDLERTRTSRVCRKLDFATPGEPVAKRQRLDTEQRLRQSHITG